MIKNKMEILQAFYERYVTPYVIGKCVGFHTVDNKIRFTFYDREYFNLYAWIEDGELHISNARMESIFDYAEENGLTEWDILCIKYGKEKAVQMTRTNLALKNLKTALEHMKSAWYKCETAFHNFDINVNDYICGSEETNDEYPFDKSLDDLRVVDWVDGAIKRINKDLK